MSINHIDHGLYITDIRSVRVERTAEFDRIISVCQDIVPHNVSDATPYEHFLLADGPESRENWGGSEAYTVFARAAESVVDALERPEDEHVLVHCHHGKNRSASVCAAALAVYEHITYVEAFAMVKDARPMVNPNHIMRENAERFIDLRT